MSGQELVLLSLGFFLAALLYASVGHAGASGYIAVMALFGLSPLLMKPTALTLNIVVASLGTYRLYRAKLIRFDVLWPLLIAAVPAAFWGGMTQLPAHWYRSLVGVVLLIAGLKFLLQPKRETAAVSTGSFSWPLALLMGAGIGALSGLTGTGGGIFLSPLLLAFAWTGVREAAGVTMPFILFNSIAGLLGNMTALKHLPQEIPIFAVVVLLAAAVGSQFTIKLFSTTLLQRLLGLVLLIAAGKFLLT